MDIKSDAEKWSDKQLSTGSNSNTESTTVCINDDSFVIIKVYEIEQLHFKFINSNTL